MVSNGRSVGKARGLVPGRAGRAVTLILATLTLLSVPVALALLLIPPLAVERNYGGVAFPLLTGVLVPLTGWTGLPLGFLTLPLLLLAFLLLLLDGRRRLRTRLLNALLLLSIVFSAYVIIWGANYRRPSFTQAIGLHEIRPIDALQARELAGWALAWLVATSEAAPDEEGALAAVGEKLTGMAATRLGLADPQVNLRDARYRFPVTLPTRLKSLPAGSLLRAGYAGMIFPLTLEPQVDGALLPYQRVAIGAHELAHAAGFGPEVEADLVALLATFSSGHEYARYSAALDLFGRVTAGLPAAQRLELEAELPERARDDLAGARELSRRYRSAALSGVVNLAYDGFLRGQGVEGGITQYRLLPTQAARARSEGLLPEPPALQRN